jgi:hypothetical protein
VVSAQCPACYHVFRVQNIHAGRAVECHNCGTPTLVPDVAPTVRLAEPVPTVRLADNAPRGSIEDATARVFWTIGRLLLTVLLFGFCAWVLLACVITRFVSIR